MQSTRPFFAAANCSMLIIYDNNLSTYLEKRPLYDLSDWRSFKVDIQLEP